MIINFLLQIVDALAALINNILRMLRSGSYTQVATTIARIERDLAQVCLCTCFICKCMRVTLQIFVSNDERDPNLRYNPISLRQMQQTYWNQVFCSFITHNALYSFVIICTVQLDQLYENTVYPCWCDSH